MYSIELQERADFIRVIFRPFYCRMSEFVPKPLIMPEMPSELKFGTLKGILAETSNQIGQDNFDRLYAHVQNNR